MGQAERISVEVSAETAEALREAVARGEFASEGEAVREALEDWSLARLDPGLSDEELGRLWDEGLASGEARDGEAAFDEIEAWLDAEFPLEGARDGPDA